MHYPEGKESREGMWAAELAFPMSDEETPTFMGPEMIHATSPSRDANVLTVGGRETLSALSCQSS